MQRLYVLLFTAFICSYSCAQNKQVNQGKYFAISATDSVYLNVYDNPDTSVVTQMIREEKKDLLIIFDGIVNVGYMDWLDKKHLKNQKIKELLKTFKIVRLFVDYKIKANPNDRFTIGEKNMWYQRNHFRTASQPFFVILRNGKPICHTGFLSKDEDIIKFFEGCKGK